MKQRLVFRQIIWEVTGDRSGGQGRRKAKMEVNPGVPPHCGKLRLGAARISEKPSKMHLRTIHRRDK